MQKIEPPSRIFLALVIVALFGQGIGKVILVIGLLSWPPAARLIRAEFLSLRNREFVEAARALGPSDLTIAVRHILPNAIPPAVVTGSLDVAIFATVVAFNLFGDGVNDALNPRLRSRTR